jgi:hypothetical protein
MGELRLRDLPHRQVADGDHCRVRGALRKGPWCWPTDPADRRKVADTFGVSPGPVGRGQVLLLAVKAKEGAGSLLRLEPVEGTGDGRDRIPLHGDARDAAMRAERLASRHLPILFDPGALFRQTRWEARTVWLDARDPDLRLEGSSYGAAMLLAWASLILDHAAVPDDLVASAALGDDGRLQPVDGLAVKLRLVVDHAPTVRRFVVAKEQEEEARRLAEGFPADERPQIVGCADAAALLDVAFPGLASTLPPQLRDPTRARTAARQLFRLAMLGDVPLLGWKHVAVAAGAVREVFSADAPERGYADFAESVARRHEGEPAVLPWPPASALEEMPAVIAQAYCAHVVQAASDGASDEVSIYTERALARLPADPRLQHDGDLRLRGAVGRALARMRRWDEAREQLRLAVEGWFDLLRPHDASLAACELLRVAGIRGNADEVRAAHDLAIRVRQDARCDFLSRAFLDLAIARAYCQAGDPAAGLHTLDAGDLVLVRAHVKESAARWRARCLDALGRPEEADRVREGLGAEAPHSIFGLYAGLDRALRDGDPAVALEALRRADARLIRFSYESTTDPRERARRVADESPY